MAGAYDDRLTRQVRIVQDDVVAEVAPDRVVRVGDTIRRGRGAGAAVVEALLVHFERVGFEAAPRFLGIDDEGRQVVRFVEGQVHRAPLRQQDDEANARCLGELAALLRDLHDATQSLVPPASAQPLRPLPVPGETWTHGDPGYPNVVYRAGAPVALIDWEFAAPAHPICDPAALLAVSVRGPRPDVNDNARRAEATRAALEAIAQGYGMDDAMRLALPEAAAAVLDDAADFGRAAGCASDEMQRMRWRAAWFRTESAVLLGR